VVLNGARVSNFGGKSLNCRTDHCKVLVNPEASKVNDIEKFIDLSLANLKDKIHVQSLLQD